jgi:chromosomal replication initiator protein
MSLLEATTLWNQTRELLATSEQTNNPKANGFLSYLNPQSLENNTLVFTTRLPFAKQHIEESYLPYIKDGLYTVSGFPLDVAIFVLDDPVNTTVQPLPIKTPVATDIPSSIAPNSVIAQDLLSPVTNAGAGLTNISGSPFVNPIPPVAAPVSATTVAASSLMATPINTTSNSQTQANITSAVSTPSQTQPLLETSFSQQTTNTDSLPCDYKTYTFESFVVGDSNNLAYHAALGIAENPGLRFNPLFIYGGSGLGKTHLLLSISDYIQRYHPTKKFLYVPTSDFVNDFTSAIAIKKDKDPFVQKYYSCDILLLDDVQYLEGREATTNALFELFNVFINQRRQIVLSADRAPAEINLDQRYTSRFGSGVTADIQAPSFEIKLAIFNNYVRYYCSLLSNNNIVVPEDVIHHIISLSGSNIRELEGAISSICFAISQRKASQKEMSVEEAEQIVGKVFLHNENRQISISAIQQEVEQHFGVSHAEMIGPHRSQNITYPRQIAMYLSRRLTSKSFPEIAKQFGKKDHTTVLYAVRNIEKHMKETEKKREIERIAEKIVQ